MVIGGQASVEVMVNSTWSFVASLPSSRYYSQAATLNNIVYVIGKKM